MHSKYTFDFDTKGIQKIHTRAVPRIGGLAIFISTSVSFGVLYIITNNICDYFPLFLLICSSLPAFIGGLIEDCTKKVSSLIRLTLAICSATLAFYLLDARVFRLDIPYIDTVIAIPLISLIFTIISIGGVINAFNIIDGFNGLASMVAILIFLSLGYVAFIVGDILIWKTILIISGAILGFFIFNYPKGLIFLGDGGAYFIGFCLASLSILLIARNPNVSPWFSFLILIYPIFETLFSIYRRSFLKKKLPDTPDALHLHQLIHNRFIKWISPNTGNFLYKKSYTSPFLWFLCSISLIPAIIFWNNTLVLQIASLCFIAIYIYFYRSLVRFKKNFLFIYLKKNKINDTF